MKKQIIGFLVLLLIGAVFASAAMAAPNDWYNLECVNGHLYTLCVNSQSVFTFGEFITDAQAIEPLFSTAYAPVSTADGRTLLWDGDTLLQWQDGSLVTLGSLEGRLDSDITASAAVGGTVYLLCHQQGYRFHPGSGTLSPIGGWVRDLAVGMDGQVYLLQNNAAGSDAYHSIVACDENGPVRVIGTSGALNPAGLACDLETGDVYWMEDSHLIRMKDGGNETLGLMPFGAGAVDRACVADGCYVALVTGHGPRAQVIADVRLSEEALVIRGVVSPGIPTMDSDFSLQTGCLVDRTTFDHYCAEEVYSAIITGENVDLYYVPYSPGVLRLIERGFTAPLSGSETLTDEAARFYPVFADAMTHEGQPHAFLHMIFVGGWRMRSDLLAEMDAPQSWEAVLNLLEAWADHPLNSGIPLIKDSLSDQSWCGEDYADAILYTFIHEQLRQGQTPNFSDARLTSLLTRLRELISRRVIHASQREETEDALMTAPLASTTYVNSIYTGGYDFAEGWTVIAAPRLDENAVGAIPAQAYVYLLSPNSRHQEQALTYLAYLAEHRHAEESGLLFADAQPLFSQLAAGIIAENDRNIDELTAKQHGAEEAEQAQYQGLITTYREANEHLRADPVNWPIYAPALERYRELALPAVQMDVSPLTVSARGSHNAVFPTLTETVHRALSGAIAMEQCVRRMNDTVQAMLMEE